MTAPFPQNEQSKKSTCLWGRSTYDGRVEQICLMKGRYRIGENGVKTAIGLPSSKGAINACVMNFGVALLILFDRQLLPLAAYIKLLQNVIEDRVQGKFRSRTATACA